MKMNAIPLRKENRGGARPNSGPKKEALSARQVRMMLNTAQQYAKKHKKTLDMVLVGFAYDEELSAKDRMAAIKLFKDKTMAPISEGGEADKQLGPAIYLPEQSPDPGKVVPIDRALEAPSG